MKTALFCLLTAGALAVEPEFPLTADSKPQPGVAKGTLLKGRYSARDGSVFPGTVREYQLYLPAGFDPARPSPFMVFQDGVIYQAPVVFDNLIAQGSIPSLVGIFVKPGVVPAANDNALPRFNRSYEYDSVTDTYSRFLIDEFLPALEVEHGLRFSTDPNQAAIAGNSSGGICAFMTAWHRPDRFRRVFTGVGTYVGIRGADRLPVLVRKIEPKPLRVFLQSGTGDNNLYCGDWWMANQMLERSLTWAGYEVNHAWGGGGHNQKHASQVFPEAMRWLWRDWQTDPEVKVNPKDESKWKGYEVLGAGKWLEQFQSAEFRWADQQIFSAADGTVYLLNRRGKLYRLQGQKLSEIQIPWPAIDAAAVTHEGHLRLVVSPKGQPNHFVTFTAQGEQVGEGGFIEKGASNEAPHLRGICCGFDGTTYFTDRLENMIFWCRRDGSYGDLRDDFTSLWGSGPHACLSPDQTQIYVPNRDGNRMQVGVLQIQEAEPHLLHGEWLYQLEPSPWLNDGEQLQGLCVDTNGWLYVTTSLGIQVCDQTGRVNFIIPTPKPALDVCFGGKDLSELFIACGDTIYKRPTKARGIVSGQQPPIKPAPPKL
jgi:gluconolactonase